MDISDKPLTPEERATITAVRFLAWAEQLAELEATPVMLLALSEDHGHPRLHVVKCDDLTPEQVLILLAAALELTPGLAPEPPSQRTPENN